MSDLLEQSRELHEEAARLKQQSYYCELKHYINKHQNYLRPTYWNDRSTGKTYTLIELAHEFNAPIVVTNGDDLHYTKMLNGRFYDTQITVLEATKNELMGRNYELVLCDEGLTHEQMAFVALTTRKLNGCIIGFASCVPKQ